MTAPQDSKGRFARLDDLCGVCSCPCDRLPRSGTLQRAAARDLDGRYGPTSPLKGWFENLQFEQGPLAAPTLTGPRCRTSIGNPKTVTIAVRIEGQWWDVPDEAVIKEPNRIARTDGVGRSIIAGSALPLASGYPLLHAGQHDLARRRVRPGRDWGQR